MASLPSDRSTSVTAGLEKNYLEFQFNIDHVRFNHIGSYFLKLTIQSSYVLLSKRTDIYNKIRVQKNEDYFSLGNEAVTEVLQQLELNKNYTFADSKFTFFLPRGFCKNDNRYDVYLRVEAFEVDSTSKISTSKSQASPRLVGELKFAIYPRTNAPKVKLLAEVGEDMYLTCRQETLLRNGASDSTEMHCGYLTYTARFRKVATLPHNRDSSPVPSVIEPTPRQPPSPVRQPPTITERPSEDGSEPNTASTTGGKDTLRFPRSPSLDESLGQVFESPVPEDEDVSHQVYPGMTHVANPGYDEILVIFHGAVNLPSLPSGRRPRPFASLSAASSNELGYKAACSTRATVSVTSAPAWEEATALTVESAKSHTESFVLKVSDADSKHCLVRYSVPVHYITPFYHYHCEFVAPKKGYSSGVRLFVTIVRKTLSLPKDSSSPNFLALEVMLRGVQRPLQNPIGSMVAVARVVTDYFIYKENMLNTSGGARAASINVTTIQFPSPHPSSYSVPPEKSEGHPQLSLPGKPSAQPQWNHPYLFSNNRDKATLFTPGAAIVIEYYQASTAMTALMWRLRSPVGFSVVLLEPEVYKQLVNQGGRMGLRLDGLPIQGTNLKTIQKGEPTIGLILRLITSETPDSLFTVSDLDTLPRLKTPSGSPQYFTTTDELIDWSKHMPRSSVTPPSPMPYSSPLFLRTRRGKLILVDI